MTNSGEIAARILSELEEAHEDDVTTLINTVMTVSGEQQELEAFTAALLLLAQSDFVRIAYEETSKKSERQPHELSLIIIKALTESLVFDNHEGIWSWDDAKPQPYVMTTDAGLERARRILDERGYQWWIRPK